MTPATFLGVWANPDDEAHLSAGLIARGATAWSSTEAFRYRGRAGDRRRVPPAHLRRFRIC